MSKNVVEFCTARLGAEELLAKGRPDEAKRKREIAFERLVLQQIAFHLEANKQSPIDHPIAAGLLPLADIWCDHPDFDPKAWFPKMMQEPDRSLTT